jgi:hypothetical protein
VQATIDNLGNIRDEMKPLVATVQMTALMMDQAKFEYKDDTRSRSRIDRHFTWACGCSGSM